MTAAWTYLLLRASVLLSLSSLAVLWLTRWQPVASPRWHRVAWALALLQGLLFFPGVLPVGLPSWLPGLAWAALGGDLPEVRPPTTVAATESKQPRQNAARRSTSRGELAPGTPTAHSVGQPTSGGGQQPPAELRRQRPSEASETTSAIPWQNHGLHPKDLSSGPERRGWRASPQTPHAAGRGKAATASGSRPALGMLWENSGAALRRSWVMMAGVVWLAGVACLGLLMAANYLLLLWGLRRCRPDVLIMHPGPVNRGIELAADVADGPNSSILRQVTNGLAVRMAVLFLCQQAAAGVEHTA